MTIYDDLLAATNSYRSSPLGLHTALQSAAQKHADWMAKNNRMSHTGEGGSQFSSRIRAEGYPSSTAGENVAWGQPTPASVVKAWYGSLGHRRNMLNTSYRSAGFGAAQSARGSWYWCGLYGAASPNVVFPLPEPNPTPPPSGNWVDFILKLLESLAPKRVG